MSEYRRKEVLRMTDTEKRAHDLALSFLQYKLSIELEGTDAEHDEYVFFQMYKESYDTFLDYLNHGM